VNLSSIYFGTLLVIAFVIRATVSGNLAKYIGILTEPPLDATAQSSGASSGVNPLAIGTATSSGGLPAATESAAAPFLPDTGLAQAAESTAAPFNL